MPYLGQTLAHCVRPSPRLLRRRSQRFFAGGGRGRVCLLAFQRRLQAKFELRSPGLGDCYTFRKMPVLTAKSFDFCRQPAFRSGGGCRYRGKGFGFVATTVRHGERSQATLWSSSSRTGT